ncbi:hypothetical protein KAR34_02110 [bacterium]|nr:hypothetical protein [bacterium]
MHLNHTFKRNLKDVSLTALDKTPDIVYFIDDNYCLQGYNPAWRHFARKNHGESVLDKFPLGTSIMAAFADQARGFYWQAYWQSLHQHKKWEQDYECSSSEDYRVYHQTATPLKNNQGLMITNRLVKKAPIKCEPHEPDKCYFNEHGSIIQCCHCRKVRNHSSEEQKWDWVPILVEKPHPDTDYTFCPRCYTIYYPKKIKTPVKPVQ